MEIWNDAAMSSIAFFWKALWGFVLGYVISSLVQVLVTRERIQAQIGETGPAAVAKGGFFGFVSSSCSFAALAATRAIMKKGAGLVPSLAFLLASTNLVVELGIVIGIFLGWQFVVAEYVGGVLLILLMWLFVRLTYPERLMSRLRDRFDSEGADDEVEPGDWREKLTSVEGWREIAATYRGEWLMVWKDVLVGFTVAGVIAAYVPDAFFETLFAGTGDAAGPSPLELVQNVVVGPVAAFFTFIGSMGNIPLAAVLFAGGVSFAGVMAFIYSDLVVFPVVRISAQYFGWQLAAYVVAVFFAALTVTALVLHVGFDLLGILPDGATASTPSSEGAFDVDYTFVLNVLFLGATAALVWVNVRDPDSQAPDRSDDAVERVLWWLSVAATAWLVGGVTVAPLLA